MSVNATVTVVRKGKTYAVSFVQGVISAIYVVHPGRKDRLVWDGVRQPKQRIRGVMAMAHEQVGVSTPSDDKADVGDTDKTDVGDTDKTDVADTDKTDVADTETTGGVNVASGFVPLTDIQWAVLDNIVRNDHALKNGQVPASVDEIGSVWQNCLNGDTGGRHMVQGGDKAIRMVLRGLKMLGLVELGGKGKQAIVEVTPAGFQRWKSGWDNQDGTQAFSPSFAAYADSMQAADLDAEAEFQAALDADLGPGDGDSDEMPV